MEDFEIVDLMEDLESVGLGKKDAFKVVGSKVAKEFRRVYTYGSTGYKVYRTSGTGDGGYSNFSDCTPVSYHTEEHEYQVGFRVLFEESFSERIRKMGEDYFYLDTTEKGIPSFTIWGNVSGLIVLKKEIMEKFPSAEILEVPDAEIIEIQEHEEN
jgi:hypothetical protein